MRAVHMKKLEIVKYLCEVGGKELIMLQNEVWPMFTLSYLNSCIFYRIIAKSPMAA